MGNAQPGTRGWPCGSEGILPAADGHRQNGGCSDDFHVALPEIGGCFDASAGNSPSGLGRTEAIGHFLGVLYFYPLYLYLNFSGYCDIVIAGASFFGMKLPENFDQPYLSRNVIDFWTRFHRTLGFWIRDYLFLPLYKAVAERWPKRADLLAFLCYFVAFFVAGIWHGPTANFVVFGLLQAVGVSAAKLMGATPAKKARPGRAETVSRILSDSSRRHYRHIAF